MNIFNDNRRYFVAAALLVLIGFCGYFSVAFQHLDDSLILEKFIGRKLLVDLMSDNLDRFIKSGIHWDTHNYQDILAHDVEKIDAATGTYAELLTENFVTISPRTPTFLHNPFILKDYPHVIEKMKANDRGETAVLFAKDAQSEPHTLYLYWRWIPTDPTLQHKYLVVLGTSKYSVDVGYSRWIKWGAMVLISVAAIFITSAIMIICSAGNASRCTIGETTCGREPTLL